MGTIDREREWEVGLEVRDRNVESDFCLLVSILV